MHYLHMERIVNAILIKIHIYSVLLIFNHLPYGYTNLVRDASHTKR